MSCYDDNPDLSEGTVAYLHGNAAKQKAYEDEKARRLSRYEEAVRLLREAQAYILDGVDMDESQEACDIAAFLAAEPKTEER